MRALRPIPSRAAAWSLVAIACSTGGFSSSLLAVERATPKANATADLSAEALLEEALACEIYGRADDREALLARAEALAPEEPAIKWHRGLILADGEWTPAEEVAAASAGSELLAEYVAKRDAAADSLHDHLALADWCAKQGLTGQERAHLARALTFDPDHAIARERRGYVRVGDEWISREEIARAWAEEAKAQASIKKYRGDFETVVRLLGDRDPVVRERAAASIRSIRDVNAIPALETLVAGVSEEASLLAIEAISAMPEKEAALSLARFAVFSPSYQIRGEAADRLAGRKLDHFVPEMLASMTTPVETRYSVARRPADGRLVYRQEFYRETQRTAELLVADTVYAKSQPGVEIMNNVTGKRWGYAHSFVDEVASRSAMDSAFVKFENSKSNAWNERIGETLQAISGRPFEADVQKWWTWWNQYNELTYENQKPVNLRYASQLEQSEGRLKFVRLMSCFAAGTPVLTNRGDVAIEQIRVGDLVLAQDVESGELAFQPVLETTIRPANEILRVEYAGGSLRCTGGHPFWVSGEGWVHARRLKSGMELHSLDGPIRVSEIVVDGAEPTYNLIVDRFADYFVGESRILCHDNSDRRPTDAIVPGLVQR